MYYHVRVTQASDRMSDEVRLDIAHDELERRFLQPYRQGQPIAIAGKSIPTDDIERIRISRTEQRADHYRRQAAARRAEGGWILSEDWCVADLATDVTDEFITGPPGIERDSSVGSGAGSRSSIDPAKVFVVHGRNLEARDSIFAFLRSLGLQPLGWSEAVQATGKTLPYVGHVLDAAFSRAQAVVVLFTPDDEARLSEALSAKGEPLHETEPTGQARPNVLFEAGMAMGRDEDRMVLVELGALRPFSDIAGRYTIRLNNTPQRRQDLAQRLRAAGCSVNTEGTDWYSVGDFDTTARGAG